MISQEALHVANVVPLFTKNRLKRKVFETEKWECELCTGCYFSCGSFTLTITVTRLSVTFEGLNDVLISTQVLLGYL